VLLPAAGCRAAADDLRKAAVRRRLWTVAADDALLPQLLRGLVALGDTLLLVH